jgi:methylase of polypeptide subunit release factors
MMEIGYNQGQAIRQLLEQIRIFTEITIEKDFHENDRIVIAKKQKTISKI